jgi:hypothetical protein
MQPTINNKNKIKIKSMLINPNQYLKTIKNINITNNCKISAKI